MGPAKLTFCGAARGVTGSCYHLELDGTAIVVDCGTFQGGGDPDAQNRQKPPFDPKGVLAAVLTHGHLDHVGRLPRLRRDGFAGPVYGHPATLDIARLIMEDTAKIATLSGTRPLYGDAEVEETIAAARPVRYGQPFQVGPFTLELFDAGHILGSSSVRIAWREGDTERAIMFSGDLGVSDTPIIRDPHTAWDPDQHHVDFVVTESTYGSRAHPARLIARQTFRDAILHAVADGGKVLIPCFAVGRTQEILYELNTLVEAGQLKGVPVIVDGPLGLDATAIYDRHRDCYDEEALALVRAGDAPMQFDNLFAARAGRASQATKGIDGPAIIIAGSGMCSGGRIRGHLAEYLDDPTTDVIFVGYQAERTLGRDLQQGHDEVSIDGRTIPVRAQITTITGYSAHADRDALATWFSRLRRRPDGAVFICHGEEKASRAYARLLKDTHDARCIIPKLFDTVPLVPRSAL